MFRETPLGGGRQKIIKIVTNNGNGLCVPLRVRPGGCIGASEMWGWKEVLFLRLSVGLGFATAENCVNIISSGGGNTSLSCVLCVYSLFFFGQR